MNKNAVIAMIAFFLSFSGIRAGDYAGDFMAAGNGARAMGMGGAFSAVADDASAYYWNPAGITQILGVEVSSIKLINAGGIKPEYTSINAVYNFGSDVGAAGAGYLRQSFGGIKIINSDGTQSGSDRETSDNALVISYARALSAWLSAGLNLKAVFGAYPVAQGDVGYSGFGFDAAILVNAGNIFQEMEGLKLGFNLQDPYTMINWDAGHGRSGGGDQVNVNLKIGAAYDAVPAILKSMNLSLGVSGDLDTRDNGAYHAGVEVKWNKSISIRAGIKGYMNAGGDLGQDAGVSFGAGVVWNFLSMDYAYAAGGIEPLQYVSITGMF